VRRPAAAVPVVPVVVPAVREEGVQVRGVVGDEIQQDADVFGVGAADEIAQVVLVAVVGPYSQTASTPRRARYGSRSATARRGGDPKRGGITP
jgi:hypothetical protein